MPRISHLAAAVVLGVAASDGAGTAGVVGASVAGVEDGGTADAPGSVGAVADWEAEDGLSINGSCKAVRSGRLIAKVPVRPSALA